MAITNLWRISWRTKHSSPCSCSELSADIEGLKLDLAIVEAAGQQDKVRVSEINQEIRAKLNYPVHQYKKQEELNGLIDANDMFNTKCCDQQWQNQVEVILGLVTTLQSDVEGNKLESHKRKEDHIKLTVSVASTLSKIENIVSELADTEKSSGSVPIKKSNLCKSIVSGRQNNKQSSK